MQKTIFITGASSGLGKSTAKLFHANGWKVMATMRNPENEIELAALQNVILVSLDVTDALQINRVVQETTSQHKVDVVLNNAGYGLVGPLESFTDEQVVRQLNTNLLGLILVSKAFTAHFRENRSGMFINVTSTFGLLSYPTCSVYSASKFGIDGFSEGLAYELAQFNIAVKVIAPGGMQTDFTKRSLDGGSHRAYKALMGKVAEGYSADEISKYTMPSEVAQIIFNAATDGKDKLRYVAGEDAKVLYNERNEIGSEAQFRKIRSMFASI